MLKVVGLSLAWAAIAGAQQAPAAAPAAPPPGPAVGDSWIDFTAPGATKEGTLAKPIHLADYKGKVVVLAFFPKARTGGCTQQMTSYRDQYSTLFNSGKDVVLLGISSDADTTLAAWAKEQNFPFQFVSDDHQVIAKLYGTMPAQGTAQKRFLYVIGPDGKITYTAKQFQPFQPSAYTDLSDAIKKAVGK